MKLSLDFPITPCLISQPWGVNGDYYQANGINIKGHNGLDLHAYHGQPVYASHDGTAYYEIDLNQGHGVVIMTNEMYDYEDKQTYFKSLYWHFCDSTKEPQYKSPIEGHSIEGKGLPVKRGDLIGYADSTGLSTGDHVHWGLKPVLFGESAGAWYNTEPNNGYMGAIDPTPYLSGKFANQNNFKFLNNMSMGDENEDVRQLQLKLQRLGYFPIKQVATGFFGQITRDAVFEFQKKYVYLNWFNRYISKGLYCYELTRNALNAL